MKNETRNINNNKTAKNIAVIVENFTPKVLKSMFCADFIDVAILFDDIKISFSLDN